MGKMGGGKLLFLLYNSILQENETLVDTKITQFGEKCAGHAGAS